jgi:hypothetical protein
VRPSIYKSAVLHLIQLHREAGAVPVEALIELVRVQAPTPPEEAANQQFVLRLYDGHEHRWWDETDKPVSWDEALRLWEEKTRNGMERASYSDGQYFDIFPADTRMIVNNLSD